MNISVSMVSCIGQQSGLCVHIQVKQEYLALLVNFGMNENKLPRTKMIQEKIHLSQFP
jgi:hypothetical protein